MDQDRFDAIVKRAVGGGSRRTVLRLLIGGALTPVLARIGVAGTEAAPDDCQNLGDRCKEGGRPCCGLATCRNGQCQCEYDTKACKGRCIRKDKCCRDRDCAPGQMCQGGRCVCTPATCAGLGKNCGRVADGCGGTLQCGECQGNQSCGGGGTPNVCACIPDGQVTPSGDSSLCCSNDCCFDEQGQCTCAGGCG